MSNYFKVKIKKCSDKDYWYKDMIGKVILVKEVSWVSAYLESKIGNSVFRYDVEPISSRKETW